MPDETASTKNLAQIKQPTESPKTPDSTSTPTAAPASQPADTSKASEQTPPPASVQPATSTEATDQPPPPSLEEKITNLTNQGPITTLINDQLASRIEQKIEQKLDHEISSRQKPDFTKWLMIGLGASMLILWIAWSGRLVWQKWF